MKKILLLLSTVLTCVSAWAQNYDGIYTMQVDENQQRGYVVAGEGYADYPVLSEITLSDYEQNSVDAIANGKNWYIATVNDGATYYFYNVAVGKFLVQEESKVNFGDEPYEWKISANGNYLNIEDAENAGKYLSGGCGREAKDRPMAFDTNKNDGGAKYTLTSVANGATAFAAQIAAADEAIAIANSAVTALSELIVVAETYKAGTNIGDYTEASIAELAKAIATAQDKVDADNVTDADIEALQAAIDALKIVLPNPDKFYVLRCNHENRYIYVNAANKLQWTGTAPTEVASNYVWKFVAGSTPNTVKMLSVHTQSYLNTVINNQQATFGEGVDVTIKKSSVEGACVFEAGNAGIGLHAHGNANTVIGYTNTAGANPYFFEEVEGFAHTLSVATSGWATLVLGFNATIPSGVEVYSVSETSSTSAKLNAVTGVVPANEAVLVKAQSGDYAFEYTTATGTVAANLLEGSVTDTEVTGKGYVLSTVDSATGFYAAELDEEGKFKNNAGKAYLPASAVPAGARFLSFDFGTETAIENVESVENNAAVYDLAGRRVQGAQKGIYVVNGKVVIK